MPFAVKLSHFSYSYPITYCTWYASWHWRLNINNKQCGCRYVRSDGTVVFGGVMVMRCALVSVLPCRQIATSRYQLQLPHQSISFDHPHPSSSCSYFSNPLSRNTRTTVESRQASPGANLRRYFHSDCDPSLTQYGVRSEKFRLALRNSFVRYCLPI